MKSDKLPLQSIFTVKYFKESGIRCQPPSELHFGIRFDIMISLSRGTLCVKIGAIMPEQDDPRLYAHRAVLVREVRLLGAIYAEFTRIFATHLDLHTTDSAAIVEILFAEDLGEPLTPARLSERISLSSGATTALLNRLESVGYVRRSRESADRRLVTLRTTEKIIEPAMSFFEPLGQGIEGMAADYSENEIAKHEEFLTHLTTVMKVAVEKSKVK